MKNAMILLLASASVAVSVWMTLAAPALRSIS
jgi:hypothetical protein